MNAIFRELERHEQRVLGALRLVDAVSGQAIDRRFEIRSAEPGHLRLVRNLSGRYVIHSWQALAAHAVAFAQPPPSPTVGSESLHLIVRDPLGQYLSRSVRLDLPRDPAPVNAPLPASLFQAAEVPMFPAANAAVGLNWCELRVSVSDGASGDALGGALVRVLREGQLMASGLSDWRGEAFVPVVGVPVQTFSEDAEAIVVSEIEVRVELYFDPATGSRTGSAQVAQGRPPAVLPSVDPDALALRSPVVTTTRVASGRRQALAIQAVLP